MSDDTLMKLKMKRLEQNLSEVEINTMLMLDQDRNERDENEVSRNGISYEGQQQYWPN